MSKPVTAVAPVEQRVAVAPGVELHAEVWRGDPAAALRDTSTGTVWELRP